MKQRKVKQQSALQFYWHDFQPKKTKADALGQFLGAIRRMIDMDEDLSDALRLRDVQRRLRRVTRITESYLYRAYELRERVVSLLEAVSGDAASAKATKNPKKRANALKKIQGSHRALCGRVDLLMSVLDDDMLLRNMHTHEQFLSLGLFACNGPYDPDDVLMELESKPDEYRSMISLLRKETKKLADEYRARICSVRKAALAVAKIA